MTPPAILFIMTQNNDDTEVIHKVIRGERPCTDLAHLGIKVEIVDGDWQVTSPHLNAAKVHISDIASGLIKYHARPTDLKKWANFVLAGSGFIDLSDCESQAGWGILLDALWDSSSRGTFSEEALQVAQELAR